MNWIWPVYSLILLAVFLILVLDLRKIKRRGDERQTAVFYRSSYDGMLGGILGYLVLVLMRVLTKGFGLAPGILACTPSPIVIAVVVMYVSYRVRIRE